MNMKTTLAVGFVVAIGCASAAVVIVMHQTARQAARETGNAGRTGGLQQAGNQAKPAAEPMEAPENLEPLSPEEGIAPVVSTPQPAGQDRPPDKSPDAGGAKTQQNPGATNAPIPKQVARSMLSFVGTDALAEEVWIQAINDSKRPSNERKDLIEDLNEDGFPDPRHVTADDLPLILSRIEIIERLAPKAMDKINSAAFQEAHKDLMNMVDRLSRQ